MSDKERGARVRFPPPLVFLTCVISGFAIQRTVMTVHYPVDRWLTIAVGLVVLLTGASLVASARILFLRTRQNPVPWTPTPQLIFTGPYRFTRNPMYVGITFVMIGIGLVRDNPWVSAFAVPALLVVHLIAVRPEETYLATKFGDPYRAYLARVRRYL